MEKEDRRYLALLLALALILGSFGYMPAQKAEAAGEGVNLIQNPNFEDEDLSMWMNTGATITRESQDEEIFDGVKTFGTISGRTQTYQGFSQDVTDVVQPGGEYEISYYIRLSEDYEGLSGAQREVFFGPYVVVDGETKYLNQSYSGDITGNLMKQIPAGQWVQLSGTYKVQEEATQVVVRFQEENSACKGSYSITGVTMKAIGDVKPPAPVTVDDSLPRLKDAITAALGEDTIVGMVTHPVNNKKEWALLARHANAITTGNELKPDYHFGYSNDRCPGTETVVFNGKSMLVPKITFSGSDAFLNAVLKQNEENPDNIIRVRGHVLVWHAQTPEWFFHEEYDPKKPYVDKEEMDRRLEWYICSLLTHYVGPDSKYKDLFYGWDVVNEACADSASQVYRDDLGGNDKLTDSTHGSKSSWWHIYQSNEFIINAFKYANKYAPASVELYYNDYNDSWPVKVPNICELLRAIKEQEGEPGVGTRIDAFGMQAHYGLGDFNIQNFEKAARAYLDIVGKIQLTELDMKASSRYDGTEATKDQEYQDQAFCYQSIFECLKKLDAIDGYEVGGITFWGVTDPTSWLQSRSDVGGGSDGLRSQCPLLFDGNYEAKPAFWAFVDPSKIDLIKKSVIVRRTYDGKFDNGLDYGFSGGSVSATMTPLWNEEGLQIQVKVEDSTADKDGDYVTVYVDEENRAADGIAPVTVKKTRGESKSNTNSYTAVLTVPLKEITMGKQILIDVTVHNGEEILSFNDIHGNQAGSSKNYACASLRTALTKVSQGTAAVDGEMEEVWDTAETLWLNVSSGDPKAAARVKVLWDKEKLYLYAQVNDEDVSAAGLEETGKDSLEIYIDEDYTRTAKYSKDDKRYRITCENEVFCMGRKADAKYVQSAVKKTDDGYVIEAAIEWSDITPKVHKMVGLDLQVIDVDAGGTQHGAVSWCNGTESENSAAAFGSIKMAVESEPREETANPDAAFAAAKIWTPMAASAQLSEETAQETQPAQEDEQREQDGKKAVSKGVIAGIAALVLILLLCVILFGKKKNGKQKPGGEEKKEKPKDGK